MADRKVPEHELVTLLRNMESRLNESRDENAALRDRLVAVMERLRREDAKLETLLSHKPNAEGRRIWGSVQSMVRAAIAAAEGGEADA